MLKETPWHFPRTELAEHYIYVLNTGAVERMMIRAPRRKGKTEFLLDDLAPLAEHSGMRVVYASMWDTREAPHEALLRVLRKANQKGGFAALKAARLKRMGVGISSPLGAISVEGELRSSPQKAPTSALSEIGGLLRELAGGRRSTSRQRKKPILLMLDEIQHLATSRAFLPLASTIRTALDELGPALKVIYTGSESAAVRIMFQRRSGLFFASAIEAPFPDLGGDYIAHIALAVRDRSRRTIGEKALASYFKRLDSNPGYLRAFVGTLIMHPSLTLEAVYSSTCLEIERILDYSGRYERLAPLDKKIVETVLKGEPLFAQASRAKMRESKNKAVPGATRVNKRLAALMKAGILMPGAARGEYLFEDGVFREWVASRHES